MITRILAQRRTGRATIATPLLLALWWLAVLAPDAEAYVDPSAGGMLVQLLLAGTAGVAVLGRLFWMRIKRIIGMTDATDPGESAPGADRRHDGV